jgi:hypothetical protein
MNDAPKPASLPKEQDASTDFDLKSMELLEAIRNLTKVMERQLEQQRSWRLALRNGLLAGLGGLLGATVVVSILVAVMQPFRRLEAIGPMIDRLDDSLKQTHRR